MNPGSPEALQAGCTCPVLDNNHGRFPPFASDDDPDVGDWWITFHCPVHDTSQELP